MGVKGIRNRKNPDCLRCEVEERGHRDKTGKGNGGLGMASFCILFTQGCFCPRWRHLPSIKIVHLQPSCLPG